MVATAEIMRLMAQIQPMCTTVQTVAQAAQVRSFSKLLEYSMPTFYSPDGNAEIWDTKPEGYKTQEEWLAAHAPETPVMTLDAAQAAKRSEINAGFDVALTASLTMPSRSAPPSAVELALAIEDFKTDDPVGWADLRAIHEGRRTSLLAAVDAATTVEAVQAINVSYAV